MPLLVRMVGLYGYPPMPRVTVFPGTGGEWGIQDLQALVDSGASHTLIRLDAAVYFGLDEAALKKQSPVHIGGVSGGIASYESRVDFRIGTPAQGEPIELFDLPVYFIDGKLPFHVAILLGQVDVLKRVVFAQLHQPPKPFFTLRPPKLKTSALLK